MADLIDRETLLKELETSVPAYYSDEIQVLDECIERVHEASAVDAEPVRHGRWIEYDSAFLCSCCGTGFKRRMRFCGECGAKMDEEEV